MIISEKQTTVYFLNIPLQCPRRVCQSLMKQIDHRKSGMTVRVSTSSNRAPMRPLLDWPAPGLK
ncbi:hypothetical protein DPMN_035046 [Dreissena polymorpha]|uniref:Uncharacterized protein n=1 Tax=Dreissena polymorpha TaxID=45954 RepID=A0A9D4RK89_DREPO|nr:hypothetical protein DPMN_035046 [Dreissena polymorpha]